MTLGPEEDIWHSTHCLAQKSSQLQPSGPAQVAVYLLQEPIRSLNLWLWNQLLGQCQINFKFNFSLTTRASPTLTPRHLPTLTHSVSPNPISRAPPTLTPRVPPTPTSREYLIPIPRPPPILTPRTSPTQTSISILNSSQTSSQVLAPRSVLISSNQQLKTILKKRNLFHQVRPMEPIRRS